MLSIEESNISAVDTDVYLYGDIEEADEYISLLQLLNNSTEDDTITIHINSYGGNLETACIICNAIMNSNAFVYGVVDNQAHSAAAVIFLACDNLSMLLGSSLMIHHCTISCQGSPSNTSRYIEYSVQEMESFIKPLYRKIMSEVDYMQMLNGKEFWYGMSSLQPTLDKLNSEGETNE